MVYPSSILSEASVGRLEDGTHCHLKLCLCPDPLRLAVNWSSAIPLLRILHGSLSMDQCWFPAMRVADFPGASTSKSRVEWKLYCSYDLPQKSHRILLYFFFFNWSETSEVPTLIQDKGSLRCLSGGLSKSHGKRSIQDKKDCPSPQENKIC